MAKFDRSVVRWVLLVILLATVMPTVSAAPNSPPPDHADAQDEAAQPMIAFRKDGNVWLMQADGSDQRALTTDGVATSLYAPAPFPYSTYVWHAWSPDGRSLLMVRDTYLEAGLASGNRTFLIHDVATSTTTTLLSGLQANAYQPSWATDGNQIAYVADAGITAGDGVATTSIVEKIDLDGTTLGSVDVPNMAVIPPEILYFMSPSLELWYRETMMVFPSLLPDIQWSTGSDLALVFTNGNGVVEVSWSSGQSRVVPPGDPALSPDGGLTGRVASLPFGAETDTMRANGDQFGPIVAWEPDRSGYYFVTGELIRQSQALDPANDAYEWSMNLVEKRVQLWHANLDEMTLETVYTAESFDLGLPSVATDGSFVVFSEIDNPTELWNNRLPGDLFTADLIQTYGPHINVRSLDVASGEVTTLVEDAGRPAVQPVAVSAGTTTTPESDSGTWSSDGSLVAFLREGNVWLMNDDGSDPRQLTDEPLGVHRYSWSPSGRYILTAHGGQSWYWLTSVDDPTVTLTLHDLATGESRVLMSFPGRMTFRFPSWAEDADALMLESGETTGGERTLSRLDLDGTITQVATYQGVPPTCGGQDGPWSIYRDLVWELSLGSGMLTDVYPATIWWEDGNAVLVNTECTVGVLVDLVTGGVTTYPETVWVAASGTRVVVSGYLLANEPQAGVFDVETRTTTPLAAGSLYGVGSGGEVFFTTTTTGSESSYVSRFEEYPYTYTDNTIHVTRTDLDNSHLVELASLDAQGTSLPSVTADGSGVIVGTAANPSALATVDEAAYQEYSPVIYGEFLHVVRVDAASGEVTTLTSNGYRPLAQPAGDFATPEPGTTPTEAPATGGGDLPAGLVAYAGADGNIWTMHADGSNQVQHTNDGNTEFPYQNPSWSPDGTMLVTTRATGSLTGEIGVFLIRDGAVEQVPNVTNCQSAAFSADATRLMLLCATARDENVTQQVLETSPALGFVSSVNLDGSDWRVEYPFDVENDSEALNWSMLTTHDISVSAVDGAVLANTIFWSSARSRQLYLFDGGDVSGFAAPAPDFGRIWGAFAPDGENILARICRGCFNGSTEAANSSIDLFDRAGNRLETIYTPAPNVTIGSFTLSPDGAWLLITTTDQETDLDFGTPGLPYVTQLIEVATGTVTDLPIDGTGYEWQPVAVSLGAPTEAEEPAGEPALMLEPGSNRIASIGTDGNVWLMDGDGGNPVQVTVDATRDLPYQAIAWSNDGTMLAFTSHRDVTGGESRLFLLRNGVVSQVPNVTGCGQVAFMPGDGQFALGCGHDATNLMNYPQSMLDTEPSVGFVSIANLDGTGWQVQVPFRSSADRQWPVAGDTWSSSLSVAGDGTILIGWYTPDGTALALVLPGGTEASRVNSPLGGGSLEGVFVNDGEGILALMCPGCYKQTREDPQMSVALLDRQGTVTETLYTPDPLARLGMPSLSSDGIGLLLTLQAQGFPFYGEIQVLDLETGDVATLAEGMMPVWQPGSTFQGIPESAADAGDEDQTIVPIEESGTSAAMMDLAIHAATCESEPPWRFVFATDIDLGDDCALAGDIGVSILGADGTDYGFCTTGRSLDDPCRLALPLNVDLSAVLDPATIPDGYEPLANPVPFTLPPDTTPDLVIRLALVRVVEAQAGSELSPADGPANAVPTSGQLAFAAKHGEQWDLYLHDFGTLITTQLTFESGSDQWAPAWSHDGSQLAYLSDSSGSNQIWMMNPDGTNPRQLTRWEGDEINAVAWGSDDQVLFITLQGDTAKSIVSMPVSGGEFTEFLAPSSAHPTIANNGSMVYVRDGEVAPMLAWSWEGASITDAQSQGFTSGAMPAVDPWGSVVVFHVGESGSRTVHGEVVDGSTSLDLPWTGNDDSNPVVTANAQHVLWVTSDGATWSIASAQTWEHNGQYATIHAGDHDQIWYLAWRP